MGINREIKTLDALLAKITDIVCCNENQIPDENSFVAWLNPGLPFQSDDFQFIKNPTASKEAMDAAESFSNQVNAVPTSANGIFTPSSANLYQIYQNVLEKSKVQKDVITEEEEARIEKLRAKLVERVKRTNIITDEEEEVVEDSALTKAYNEYMEAYESALLAYNAKRISAINGDPQAVQDFALNGNLYKKSVTNAMNNWISKGYKKDYEAVAAYLQQVMSRSAAMHKARLKENLEASYLTAASGQSFPFTQFYPSHFMDSDNGWTDFSFTSTERDQMEKESHSETTASVGFQKGLFSGSADASYGKDEKHVSIEGADFSMKFKIAQVFISRPWFSLDFLLNNSWDWDEKNPLSDGEKPVPQGQMIGFPTSAIFVKDVEIKSSSIKQTFDEVEKKLSAGGSIGWGPFRLGAKHNSSSKETHTTFDEKTGTMKIEGMQLLAYKCFRMPKTPDCKVSPENLI